MRILSNNKIFKNYKSLFIVLETHFFFAVLFAENLFTFFYCVTTLDFYIKVII